MKKWSGLALIMCMILACTGCQKTEAKAEAENQTSANTTEENTNQYKLDVLQPSAYGNVDGLTLETGSVISIIGRGSASAYWKEVEAGAKQAIDDINSTLGYKGDDKVKLVYAAPKAEDDVDDQVNILDEELARYPVALGIAAVDSSACEVQFDLAVENTIPIVAFDSGTDYQSIVSMVDTNNIAAAKTAAGKLCDSIDDTGEIALFVHDSKSTSAKEREAGFLEEIQANQPDVSVVKIYHLDELEAMQKEIAAGKSGTEGAGAEGTLPEGSSPEGSSAETDPAADTAGSGSVSEQDEAEKEAEEKKAAEITQDDVIQYILEQNPNIKGCFATNEETAKLVVDACEQLELEDIKIVSFDGGEDQLKRLDEGKLTGLVVQNPYGIGYATVVACARAVLEQGNEAEVDTGYTWVTEDNIKNEAIQKMMY